MLRAFDLTFVVAFTVEVALKLAGLSLAGFWADMWNRLDAVCVCFSYVALVSSSHPIKSRLLFTPSSNPSYRYLALVFEAALSSVSMPEGGLGAMRTLRLLRLVRLLRIVRSFSLISAASIKTRVLAATFWHFKRIVLPMLLPLAAVSYVYVILRMEYFRATISRHDSMAWGDYCAPWCPSFESFGVACLTVFQLLIAANWGQMLDEVVRQKATFEVPALFFLSYVFLCHVFMFSLLGALVLEVYTFEMDKVTREDGDDKLRLLCEVKATTRSSGERDDAVVAAIDSMGLGDAHLKLMTEQVRTAFDAFGVDGTGSFSALELSRLLVSLGSEPPSADELAEMLADLDCDQSGFVDYDEFLPVRSPCDQSPGTPPKPC
jgi:hypothetical protein